MQTTNSPIVISGFGLVLPQMNTLDQLWTNWSQGHTAIERFADPQLQSNRLKWYGFLSSEQQDDAQQNTPHKMRRYAAKSSQWGLLAVQRALENAQLKVSDYPADAWGLYCAQGDHCYPGFSSYEKATLQLCASQRFSLAALREQLFNERGGDPFVCIKSLTNNLLATVSLSFQLKGDCGAYGHDEMGAVAALRQAHSSLSQGKAQVALVVLTGSQLDSVHLARLLAKQQLCEDEILYPLLDQRRQGLIPADGAVALLLETAAHAKARQHTPWAQLNLHAQTVARHVREAQQHAYAHLAAHASFDGFIADLNGISTHDAQEMANIAQLHQQSPIGSVHCAAQLCGHLTSARLGLQLACAALMLKHQQAPALQTLTPEQHTWQHIGVGSHGLLGQYALLGVSRH